MTLPHRLEHDVHVEVLRTFTEGDPRTPQPLALDIAPSAREAVRLVERQLRDNALFRLAPGELARALAAYDRAGRLPALAALHRGEPCGFAVRCDDGTWAEWHLDAVHARHCGGACS